MAFLFGDSFDLYTALADCAGYWDASLGSTTSLTLTSSGRFAGSRGITTNAGINTPYITKTSGVNDAIHHVAIAIQQPTSMAGTNQYFYFTFYDGTNAQCTVVFRQDGAILLLSGNASAGTIATYTGAIAAINTWYAFEIEIVIHGTTGSISVRKNGNPANDFTLGSLNTRNGSSNNYANKIGLGCNYPGGSYQNMDDFLWRSDASSVPWMGDIRCYTRMPASDASVVFSRNAGTTNFGRVSEAQQDGITSYVFDSTVNDADFYGIASIASTPVATIAVTTRGYMQKSDAGTRTAAVQLKSGSATVASPTLVLTTSGWQWAWRTDTVDPNTSAAWTAAAVNNVNIGPKTIA